MTYRYTGNAFDQVSDQVVPAGTYTTSMRVEVSFTLAQLLPANQHFAIPTADVVSFSFRDGRHVVEDEGSPTFEVQTDANGEIVDWELEVTTTLGAQSLWIFSSTFLGFDTGQLTEAGTTDGGGIVGSPGVWDRVPTAPYGVYEYTGLAFDTVVDEPVPSGTYDTSMRVDVSLTLTQPLPAGQTTVVPPDEVFSFSFSDGRHIVTDEGSYRFEVQTDANGAIVDWELDVTAIRGAQRIQIISSTLLGFDTGRLTEAGTTDVGVIGASFGSWNETVVEPVPVPALCLLMRLALLGSLSALAIGAGRNRRP